MRKSPKTKAQALSRASRPTTPNHKASVSVTQRSDGFGFVLTDSAGTSYGGLGTGPSFKTQRGAKLAASRKARRYGLVVS